MSHEAIHDRRHRDSRTAPWPEMTMPQDIVRADAAESAAAHAIAERMAAGRHELAQRIADRCREEIADYRLVDEPVLADVVAFALDSLDALTAAMRDGQPASAAWLEPARAVGRRRFHQRVALESFLHAVRIWARVVWDAVLEEVRPVRQDELEAALIVASRLLAQIDEISTVAAEAYLDEVSDPWLLRRDLMDALVTGRGDGEVARRRAGTLGLRLADSYVVIVLRASDADPQDGRRPSLRTRVALDRIVHQTRCGLHPEAGGLIVGMRHGDVVALYPVSGPDGAAEARHQCAALVDALGIDVVVGMGGWHAGLAATASGYREALDAADIAQAKGIRDHPVALDEVLVDHIYRSSPCADRILAETIRPLIDYDRTHRSSFVTTLRAYLDAGLNLTRTARAVHVHPNTVEYRLRRIRELSGRDPRNPDDLLILSLATKFDELRSPDDADRNAA
jgi:sugar diacid utilization regulator